MSKQINIVPNRPELQKDFACRWKMDALRVKKEGHGKNVRTCITNITTVAQQLNIPATPQYISKYLALELGSRTQWDKNRKVALIKGVHSQETLQEKLQGFLDLFILCKHCTAPELRHVWKRSGKKGRVKVMAHCVGCGWKGPSLRSGHGVEKFIARHPPPKGRTSKRADATPSDEVTFATKKKPEAEENWDAWTLGTKTAPEVLTHVPNNMVSVNVTGPEMVAVVADSRVPKTTEQWWQEMHKKGAEGERQPKTPLGLFRAVLARPDAKLIDLVSEFLRLESTHKLDQLAVTRLVLDACLDFEGSSSSDSDNPYGAADDDGIKPVEALSESIERNHLFLNWFTSQAQTDHMRSECDMMLMSYIENELVNRGMVRDVPQVLEVLYDNYVFDAGFFVTWADQKTGYVLRDPSDLELVRNAAKPFTQWAQANMTPPPPASVEVETEV